MNVIDATMFRAMIRSGAMDIQRHSDEVNMLNVFPVPDGDTGLNMFSTIHGGVEALERCGGDSLGESCKALSRGMLLAARGNSGVILSQFFAGLADVLSQYEQANVLQFAQAFEAGVKRAYEVVIKPVEGTILTVMREGSEYALSRIDSSTSFEEYFTSLLEKMRSSLMNTPELLPILKDAGVIDSGGAGLLYIVEGMGQTLGGKIIEDVTLGIAPSRTTNEPNSFDGFDENSVFVYGYCTEFILQLTNEKGGVKAFNLDTCIEYLSSIGDSLVAFQDGTLVKVHVHTKTPDQAIKYALQFGEFVHFKMENMTLQHNQTITDISHRISVMAKPEEGKRESAIVAVVPNSSVGDVFTTYGADFLIDGGKMMNPGTDDFLKAFKRANANNIFLFPNNKNEIMVANMAAEMYDEGQVHIIPTADIAEGLSCCSVMDLADLSVEDNLSRIEGGLSTHTFSLFLAARDSIIGGTKVRKGEYIWAEKDSIRGHDVSPLKVFERFLDESDAENASLLVILYSDKVPAELKTSIEELTLSKSDFMEIQPFDSGDCLYEIYAFIE